MDTACSVLVTNTFAKVLGTFGSCFEPKWEFMKKHVSFLGTETRNRKQCSCKLINCFRRSQKHRERQESPCEVFSSCGFTLRSPNTWYLETHFLGFSEFSSFGNPFIRKPIYLRINSNKNWAQKPIYLSTHLYANRLYVYWKTLVLLWIILGIDDFSEVSLLSDLGFHLGISIYPYRAL